MGSTAEPESHRGVLINRKTNVLRDLIWYIWWIFNLWVLSLRYCGEWCFHCQWSCGKVGCCALSWGPSGHGSHTTWCSRSPTNCNDRKKEKVKKLFIDGCYCSLMKLPNLPWNFSDLISFFNSGLDAGHFAWEHQRSFLRVYGLLFNSFSQFLRNSTWSDPKSYASSMEMIILTF